jgi:hypothetical protein
VATPKAHRLNHSGSDESVPHVSQNCEDRMTDVNFTFCIDPALNAAFAIVAEEKALSPQQLLRRLMREAVEIHREAAAHECWLQREIVDAMYDVKGPRRVAVANEVVDHTWHRDRCGIAP